MCTLLRGSSTAHGCAPVAESVDALDLKSNRAYNPVPVQVWPGANLKDFMLEVLFNLVNILMNVILLKFF